MCSCLQSLIRNGIHSLLMRVLYTAFAKVERPILALRVSAGTEETIVFD